MNKFKMICLDIDGTLLNSDHQISNYTKDIIKIASNEKQVKVILVSGRMPKGIWDFKKQLNIMEPVICYNGSLIVDNKKSALLSVTIPIPYVKQVYELAKEMLVHVSLYKDDEWYVEKVDKRVIEENEITGIKPNVMSFMKLCDIWEKEKSGPNKILCIAEPDDIKRLSTKIENCYHDNLCTYPSKPTYLEVMLNSASKTSAIEFLCKKFNVQKSEVIAIGDNYNDINMIEYAGLGIAMGNAPDKVKKCADDITFSNDEDGVAKSIEKYIL